MDQLAATEFEQLGTITMTVHAETSASFLCNQVDKLMRYGYKRRNVAFLLFELRRQYQENRYNNCALQQVADWIVAETAIYPFLKVEASRESTLLRFHPEPKKFGMALSFINPCSIELPIDEQLGQKPIAIRRRRPQGLTKQKQMEAMVPGKRQKQDHLDESNLASGPGSPNVIPTEEHAELLGADQFSKIEPIDAASVDQPETAQLIPITPTQSPTQHSPCCSRNEQQPKKSRLAMARKFQSVLKID